MNRIIGIVGLNWLKLKKIFQFTPHDITSPQGKSHERYRRILLTGGSTAIVKIFSALINLITVPLTVNYLGAERYGLWMAISSVIALMSFADLGLGNGLLNAVSRANARSSKREAQIAVSSTFFILVGISGLLLLIFIPVFPVISWQHVFNVKSAIAIKESGPTVMALAVILVINIPLGIVERIQSGYQEGFKFQLWLVLGSLLSFIGILFCIYFKSGLVWLVVCFSAGPLVATILNGIYLFAKKRKYLLPKLKYFNWSVGKSLINSGMIFFLLGFFTLIANTSDDIIIAQTLGPSSVAGFEIVKKLFLFSMFTQFIIQPLWPAFAEAVESGDFVWARRTVKKALYMSITCAGIISLPLLLFGKQIITIWISADYEPSWPLLAGFYIFVLLANYGGVMSTFLNSGPLLGRQIRMIGLASLTSVLLKVILSLKFGVSGIIWATVIGYSIFYVVPSYKLTFNYLNKKLYVKKNLI